MEPFTVLLRRWLLLIALLAWLLADYWSSLSVDLDSSLLVKASVYIMFGRRWLLFFVFVFVCEVLGSSGSFWVVFLPRYLSIFFYCYVFRRLSLIYFNSLEYYCCWLKRFLRWPRLCYSWATLLALKSSRLLSLSMFSTTSAARRLSKLSFRELAIVYSGLGLGFLTEEYEYPGF